MTDRIQPGHPRSWTSLKRKGVHATFMMIGEQAQDNVGLLKRVMAEGNEIGNHTFTHPGHQRNIPANSGAATQP